MRHIKGSRQSISTGTSTGTWTSAVLFALLAALVLTTFTPATAQSAKYNEMMARDHVNKGNSLMARRLFAEAIGEYQKAIDLDPGNSAAKANIVLTHLNWGALHFQQNKFDEATAEWETVLQLDPYNQSAKHNLSVLKQTLARRGQQAGAQKAEGAPGASAAKPGAGGAKPGAEKKPESSVVLLTPIKKSQERAQAEAESEEEASEEPAAPAAAPAAQATSAPSAPAAPAGASLEDQLAAIEMKIYGHKLTDMTVLKRLEKMETDTAGQARTGTIKERIDFLRKSYGL